MQRNPVALIEFLAFMGVSLWLVYSQFLAPRGRREREPPALSKQDAGQDQDPGPAKPS